MGVRRDGRGSDEHSGCVCVMCVCLCVCVCVCVKCIIVECLSTPLSMYVYVDFLYTCA